MSTIIIGDVHGCADELDELLERVEFTAGDDLFFVGDLVNRGPDPHRVLGTARRLGARSVRGNHEDSLLRKAQPSHLDDDDWSYLRDMPPWIEVVEHGLRIVHAGVMPGVPIEQQQLRHLLYLRALDEDGGPVERRDEGTLWGQRYLGPPHVVFGHHALPEPQVHRWATGIDTACVFGGRLTALVLDPDQPAGSGRLVSVPARRAYVAGVLNAADG